MAREAVIQQVLEAEMGEVVGAGKGERPTELDTGLGITDGRW